MNTWADFDSLKGLKSVRNTKSSLFKTLPFLRFRSHLSLFLHLLERRLVIGRISKWIGRFLFGFDFVFGLLKFHKIFWAQLSLAEGNLVLNPISIAFE